MQTIVLSQEKIESNYLSYIKRLMKYNAYSEKMINELGEKIKNGSFYVMNESGGAYYGSLINIVLNQLCSIGMRINEQALGFNGGDKAQHPLIYVNKEKLMKVLLLQHISKAELYEPETEPWRLKRGMLFKFSNDYNTRLKVGQRSIYLCNKYGIQLDEDEFEAMLSIDTDEERSDAYSSPLNMVVKVANLLTSVNVHQEVYLLEQDYKEKNKPEL